MKRHFFEALKNDADFIKNYFGEFSNRENFLKYAYLRLMEIYED
jgi:hypothetical protein